LLKPQVLFHYRYQHVNRNRNPYLGLDGIFLRFRKRILSSNAV
jgi:hypothetical protein